MWTGKPIGGCAGHYSWAWTMQSGVPDRDDAACEPFAGDTGKATAGKFLVVSEVRPQPA